MHFFSWGKSSNTLLSAPFDIVPLGSQIQRLETNSSDSMAVRAHRLGLYERTSVLNVGVVVPEAKDVFKGAKLPKMALSS